MCPFKFNLCARYTNGGSIASNMISNVMNIDDFPRGPDRNVGLSAGVQPLPPSFKMTAQD